METAGAVMAVEARGGYEHVCWVYRSRREFRNRAAEFLTDGLRVGQQAVYAAEGSRQELAADLRLMPGLATAMETGAAVVFSLTEAYPSGYVVDPVDQLHNYAAATEAAVRQGYAGLRVAADASNLVTTAEQVDAFCRYEHLIDRYMARRPFRALCGYRRGAVPAWHVSQLACLHPAASSEVAPFHLHSGEDGALVLRGALDFHAQELLERTLPRVSLRDSPGGRAVIDARNLEFVDHRALLALDAHAQRERVVLVLRHASLGTERLAHLLGLRHLGVEKGARA